MVEGKQSGFTIKFSKDSQESYSSGIEMGGMGGESEVISSP